MNQQHRSLFYLLQRSPHENSLSSRGIFKRQSEAIAEYHGCPWQRTAARQTMNTSAKEPPGGRNTQGLISYPPARPPFSKALWEALTYHPEENLLSSSVRQKAGG